MNSLLPIFAVGLLAAGELREWSHYPSEAEAWEKYGLAKQYNGALEAAYHQLDGAAQQTILGQWWDAGEVVRTWRLLWTISSDQPREEKLKAERELIEAIGAEAWARGQWPAVFSPSLFARPGGYPAIPLPPLPK